MTKQDVYWRVFATKTQYLNEEWAFRLDYFKTYRIIFPLEDLNENKIHEGCFRKKSISI